MINMDRREALRGAETQTFDLLAKVLTPLQWEEWLRVPLEHAAHEGNRGLAQKLQGAGAEIRDALHAAAESGHEEIVNDLLENGASIHAKGGRGNTPLHCAARAGKTEVVQLLLLKGAYKEPLNCGSETPLHLTARNGHMAAALALLAAGADVNLRGGYCRDSVLHKAVYHGHVDMMRLVIERGADVDGLNTCQSAPLHYAASHNKVEAIDVLVEAGANMEARDDESATPLHGAASTTSLEAVLALAKHGADVNAQDRYRDTPLHRVTRYAGKPGTALIVDSLLRSGADETILNAQRKAAADVAEFVQEKYQLVEDIDRVRKLLANAPADRVWRRRGYLVLCRAHPDRVRQTQDISSAHDGMVARSRSGAKLGRTETRSCTGTAGSSTGDGWVGGDWAVVVAMLLGLQEEGIFRSIVVYL